MPKAVRVAPEDLMTSASTVDAHADTMRSAHATAQANIEAAHIGVPGGAAVALTAAVTKWQADSTAMFAQLVGHAEALRDGARVYVQVDEHGAAAIDSAGNDIVDLGL